MAKKENKSWTRLVELRKAKGYSQVELARIIGISNLGYCRWENGVFEPSNADLVKLADALETTTDYLLGRDVDNTLTPSELENLQIAGEVINHIVKKCKTVSKNEKAGISKPEKKA